MKQTRCIQVEFARAASAEAGARRTIRLTNVLYPSAGFPRCEGSEGRAFCRTTQGRRAPIRAPRQVEALIPHIGCRPPTPEHHGRCSPGWTGTGWPEKHNTRRGRRSGGCRFGGRPSGGGEDRPYSSWPGRRSALTKFLSPDERGRNPWANNARRGRRCGGRRFGGQPSGGGEG